MSRRALVAAAVAAPLAACSVPSPSSKPSRSTAPSPTGSGPSRDLLALERRFDARLGVFAHATGTGRTVAHRADERFAFCSTFKGLAAAAVLHHHPLSYLDERVWFGADDLMKSSVVTRDHVATGLTIRELCDAAVRFSDGTAGNLLLRDLGGPARLTEYARLLGDTVTRMDRIEPAIVEATPGDPRDTSSPRALGRDYQALALGEVLSDDKRDVLTDLLRRSTTGAARIRASIPEDWEVANKTGTGSYGTLNDIAVAWPPDTPPLVISIMSSRSEQDAEHREELLAEAATLVISAFADS